MTRGMGWRRDRPDHRDYTPYHPTISKLLPTKSVSIIPDVVPPPTMDLRPWCSPIEDQGNIGSCTAQAGIGLYEYWMRRIHGKYVNVSRLFTYKTTRTLMKLTGDTGAELRATMGSLVLFGVPPESYWPYREADFDKEPPAFTYAFGQTFQALRYFRLDPPSVTLAEVLRRVKVFAASGWPSIFGFTVYSSIWGADTTGEIPFPGDNESVEGGHAVMVVGYDDAKVCPGANSGKGALLIRNSWGTGWGQKGYGWLPYRYVTEGLAVDWWVMTKAEWVDLVPFIS